MSDPLSSPSPPTPVPLYNGASIVDSASVSRRQGAFSRPTYSVRTPAVRPHACPPPTMSAVFLTAIMISWAEGDDGGSSVTGFTVRPTGGGEAEEVRCRARKLLVAYRTPFCVRFLRCNFFAGRTPDSISTITGGGTALPRACAIVLVPDLRLTAPSPL